MATFDSGVYVHGAWVTFCSDCIAGGTDILAAAVAVVVFGVAFA
jgi:hypothetical protein